MRTKWSNLAFGAALLGGGAVLVRQVRQFRRHAQQEEAFSRAGNETPRRIVVVGVGFGGVGAANRLGELVGGDPRFDVLLIDRHNYHLFYPLLYQVATGGVEPGSLAYPARMIARQHGFRFLDATVTNIDVNRKTLMTDAGPVDFDALIVAPGSVTNYFGMQDAAEHAMPLKSLPDGERLHNRVIDSFEAATRAIDPELRRTLLTFVVVGGGATGVELSASLSDLIFTALLPNYPSLSRDDIRLVLIEARGTLLPGWNPRMGVLAAERLQWQHVELMLNTTVSHVTGNGIETGPGEIIPAATVVWTAGVKADPIVSQLPGDKERDGRVKVNEYLELPGHPGIYVVGDAASFINPGAARPLPPTAPAAADGGRQAATNAIHRLTNEAPEAFVYHSKGDLVSLGRGSAAADLFGVVFDGIPAWIVRRGVYLVNLAGFRNRVSVVLSWAMVSFHERVIASFDNLQQIRPFLRAASSSASSTERQTQNRG